MRALLWKDYRLNRLLLAIGLGLLLGPYAAVVVWQLHSHWPIWPQAAAWAQLLVGASTFSLSLSLLTLVLLAGNAFAGERADRSAEFLAYLPPSRARVLISKALLAFLVATVIWVFNLLVAEGVVPALSAGPVGELAVGPNSHLATAAVLVFGAGWLGSSFLESPTFATTIGIVAPLAVSSLLALSGVFLDWPPREDFGFWWDVAFVMVGVLSFAGGTWYYLRRVEP
jgi:ABC-type transport system involved in multi-copper enzyme maturation permease subunit